MHQLGILSREVCIENAISVARIFERHHRRFEIRFIYFSAVQHAGTAATALIDGIRHMSDPEERAEPLHNLRVLTQALHGMSPIYQPAERMSHLLEHVFERPDWKSVGRAPTEYSQPEMPTNHTSKRPIDSMLPASGADYTSKRPRIISQNEALDTQANRQPSFTNFMEHQGDTALHQQFDPQSDWGSYRHGSVDLGLPAYEDVDWQAMLDPRPGPGRRSHFLDLSSGFDELFNGSSQL